MKIFKQADAHIRNNVTIKAFDAQGKTIKLWKENVLGKLTGIKSFFTGRFVNELKLANVITNVGVAQTASLLISEGTAAAFQYIAVGSGTAAESSIQTQLVSEFTGSGMTRRLANKSKITTTIEGDTAVLEATYTATAPVTITESGVFDAASEGKMVNRKVFGAVNLPQGGSLQVQHQFQMSPLA